MGTASSHLHEQAEHRTRQHRSPQTDAPSVRSAAPVTPATHTLAGLLGPHTSAGRGNGSARQAAVLQLQQAQGNRATRRLLQRLAHPAGAAPAPARAGLPVVQRVVSVGGKKEDTDTIWGKM